MFSALKKLTKGNDERCPAPVPMSSSLQKKFSKGVHFNMKILIKGDRNVGKSCLLQRLQGGPFIENYVPTEQIQVAPIHWTYKNTDHIVKVEVWEVVDKGKTKKKTNLGLKLENQNPSATQDDDDIPVLDATFLDVYKNATGVILMLDITKPWTFDYVLKELERVPPDLPVVILGNHCDMQHHRQVHAHHIEPVMHQAKSTRDAPIRYAESSMRNGFGLRLLHKFLSVPFLRLQRTSLLEQLQRNQKDIQEVEQELTDFQNSEESQYNLFVDRLASKRRQGGAAEPVKSERSPSIVLGAGKPIVPPNVNPLMSQSLNPMGIKAMYGPQATPQKTHYVSAELMAPKSAAPTVEPSRTRSFDSNDSSKPANVTAGGGDLEEFYAGALDSSFLDDIKTEHQQEPEYDSDSDDGNAANPMVAIDQDDLDIESPQKTASYYSQKRDEDIIRDRFKNNLNITRDSNKVNDILEPEDSDLPLWARDTSARRSPEGTEDPDASVKETSEKTEKKHKKKKSKDKEKSDYGESEKKEKKNKHKKSKSEKRNPQQDLLVPEAENFDYCAYDSL